MNIFLGMRIFGGPSQNLTMLSLISMHLGSFKVNVQNGGYFLGC